MTIGIFQDIHANLPAFKKAIEFFKENNCTKIYHVGDLIGIGPYPKEVFDLAISIKELTLIMGNHDYWFAFGLPDPQPAWMSDEEVEHQKWNHQQIGEEKRGVAQKWKFEEDLKLDNKVIRFQHYGYDKKTNWFKSFVKVPDRKNIDHLFENVNADYIFYGHQHEPSDIQGKARYVNLGSAGCHSKPELRLGLLKIENHEIKLSKHFIQYQDDGLMEAFEIRKVPARDFITKTFLTRK